MKITVRVSFVLYLIAIYLLSSIEACAGLVLSLAVHELGHFLVIWVLKEPIERVEIAPFGGVMTYKPGRSASKGLKGAALAAAGPLANYAAIILLSAIPKTVGGEWIRQAILSSLSMMIINLIPALPLDGGAILFSFGFYLFDVSALIRVLSLLGVLTGAALCTLAFYGWVSMQVLNLSLLVVGVYLMYAALAGRERMLGQNLVAVIQERLSGEKAVERLRLYMITPDFPLWDMRRFIGRIPSAAFVVEYDDGIISYMNEKDVCRALLEQPTDTVGEFLKNNAKKKRFLP